MGKVAGCVLWVCVLLSFGGQRAEGKLRLASVFGDHMVLQRGRAIRVWGWADAGGVVEVRLGKEKRRAKAGGDGRWEVKFSARGVGKMLVLEVRDKTRTIRHKGIQVGEVWLCGGQSNMVWPLSRTVHGRKAIAGSRRARVVLFSVAQATRRKAQKALVGRWVGAHPSTVRGFSAVCYQFGRRLAEHLGVVVGLIQAAVGGTVAEAWIPHGVLAGDARFQPILRRQRHWERVGHARAWKRWRALVRAGRTRGAYPPARRWHFNSPSGPYNAMIAPLVGFGIRGVLWYQGESNIPRAVQYKALFAALVKAWRKRWGQGTFPFLTVQLAPFRYGGWPRSWYNELCEAQVHASRHLPKVAMVTTNDLGDQKDIHPRRKEEVGRRLFLASLPLAYGQSALYSGPIYRGMKRKGRKLVLSFFHAGSGLVAKGGALRWFEVAGKDRRFVKARAKIIGSQVIVWSVRVSRPVAVRFAWRSDAVHRLFNKEGFPASCFRSDDWKRLTADRR